MLLDSADLFTTSNRRSTSQSSRSAESDLTSSTEVDSGYSSSVDIRRFNLLNGESSPEQHKANFRASYENTSIEMENRKNSVDAYEFMSPPFNFGPVSSPISIPKQGSGESWRARGDYNILPTPVLAEGKYPLDFGNFLDPQFSAGKGDSPPPLSAKTSSSLPNTSTMQISLQEPRLSKTASPPGSKKTSGAGETFAPEMLKFQKEVSVPKSCNGSSSTPEEDDIYEELVRPLVDVPAGLSGNRANSTSSRDSLKAHNENAYENHCFPLMFKSQKEGDSLDCGYDRIRCNSANQPQRGREVIDARCNSWPTQQNYDNHKLRDDASTASPSQSCCYDNHRLRSLETALSPSALCYDNWKIKNEECNVSEKKKRPSCYENVELSNGEEICHGTETFCSAEKTTSSNNVSNVAQSYEDCLPKSAKTSYENFTPKHLQDDSFESNQKGLSTMLYENCEVLDKKKKTSETLKAITSGNGDHGCHSQGLSSSLPTNCCCVDVIHGDNESMSIIMQKRTIPTLARTRSVNIIEQVDCPADVSKDDPIGLGVSGDSDDNHPIPPPRWKRIARFRQPQSVEGCSQAKWSVCLHPEIASALRRRGNGATAGSADNTPVEITNDSYLVQDSQTEAVESEKPALPPHVKTSNTVVIDKHLNMTCNAYENVMLQSKNSTEEISPSCLPELPTKKKQSTGSKSSSRSNAAKRALHYENVGVVIGFHVESNGDVASALESCTPPPLPRKMSQKKEAPVVPCRIDLEQKCAS